MAGLRVKGIAFDMYGVAFNHQWRAKQLEYTFLRTLMGKYRDFWKVTEEALDFAFQRFALQVTPLSDPWCPPCRF